MCRSNNGFNLHNLALVLTKFNIVSVSKYFIWQQQTAPYHSLTWPNGPKALIRQPLGTWIVGWFILPKFAYKSPGSMHRVCYYFLVLVVINSCQFQIWNSYTLPLAAHSYALLMWSLQRVAEPKCIQILLDNISLCSSSSLRTHYIYLFTHALTPHKATINKLLVVLEWFGGTAFLLPNVVRGLGHLKTGSLLQIEHTGRRNITVKLHIKVIPI